MLTWSGQRHALNAILKTGHLVLGDISDAMQVMELAENFGKEVVLVQDRNRWVLLVAQDN